MSELSGFEQELRTTLTNALDAPGMVGGILVMAEVVMEDGSPYLFIARTADLTYWREMGMIEARKTDIIQGNYSYIGGEEDE